jgi:hypothetical protein
MQPNYVRQPLLIIAVVTLLLCTLSFIETENIFPKKLKQIDLFADLKTSTSVVSTESEVNNSKKNKQEETNKTADILSLKDYSIEKNKSFSNLLLQLKNARNEKVHIAYFGDSFIESDLVTNELRQLLQKQYGGNGVGFIPIQTINSDLRKSIGQQNSTNWATQLNESKLLTACQSKESYTNFTIKKPYAACTQAKLFYKSAEALNILIKTDSNKYESNLPVSNSLHAIKINKDSFTTIGIQFPNNNTTYYGFSFEDSMGVYVDNFSVRGSNGTHLLKIDTTLLQEFNTIQNYSLIILHFGINVLNNDTKLDWYKIGLQKTITFIKNQFPNATILIISTSDKSTKQQGIYETDKGMQTLITLQQNVAQQNHICFWNLYENMGGYNSMISWVKDNPVKAYKDYTHITYTGAAKVAEMLYKQFNK